MRQFLSICFLLFFFCSPAQNEVKSDALISNNPSTIIVCLKNSPKEKAISNEFTFFLNQIHASLKKAISISDDKIDFLSKEAIRISKSDYYVQKLTKIYKVDFEVQPENFSNWVDKIRSFPEVEYCYVMKNIPIQPPTDIAPVTSNFEMNQTYLGANPGINMQYAWDLGLSGQGIKVRDVEYGFNSNHEELNAVNVSIASGMTINSSATSAYTEHGTSVFGVVMADKGTYGVSGLAYSAQEMILYPEWQQSGYNRVFAVSQAIQNSQPGDVIIYEMQAYDENNYLLPAEYDLTIWNLTKAATDAGIMIIEAAANGSRDLDSPTYATYMNRGNSGAILVGAGTSDINHEKLSFSNYGSRVDVQGWGQNVFTCGFYGSYFTIGGDLNQSYTNFAGTSSATPMVAGCAIVLQSYYHSLTGNYLTPLEMKNLLINTGISQGISVSGHIGPLPNMQNAINAIDAMLSVQNFDGFSAEFFPNPSDGKLNYAISNTGNPKIDFHFLDVLGREMKQIVKKESTGILDISDLPSGIYFLKVKNEEIEFTKRIIKR
ncbi:MAG: S8/S53 family peptidase [Bacteroidota bacterium]